jgi:flotillin
MSPVVLILVMVVALVIFLLLLMNLLGSLYHKVGPIQALIVYGKHGGTVFSNGGAFVMPLFQRAQVLSLELMPCEIAPEGSYHSREGVVVQVRATALLKVRDSREGILTAAERFLNKTDGERVALLRPAMEAYLRSVVSRLAVEELVKEPQTVHDRMRASAAADLDRVGLEVELLTIKEVRDENNRSLM